MQLCPAFLSLWLTVLSLLTTALYHFKCKAIGELSKCPVNGAYQNAGKVLIRL